MKELWGIYSLISMEMLPLYDDKNFEMELITNCSQLKNE